MKDSLLNRIRMVSLRVREKRASERWYVDKLGLKVVWSNETTTGLQARNCEGAFVMLIQASDPSRFDMEAAIHFTTDEIRETYERIKTSGSVEVEPIQTAGLTSAFVFHDRNGSPTMVWAELDPVLRANEIAALMERFVPVFA